MLLQVFHQLHWLQVEYWIRLRVLVLTFKVLNGLGTNVSTGLPLLVHPPRGSLAQEISSCPQPKAGLFLALALTC